MGGSVGPLELADDTRWLLVNSFFSESSCRSEASDPGGVAGATLVKIAIFSVNPVTKTGLVTWSCVQFDRKITFYARRTENVHDAYATFALPPHHCTYHTGWILSFCLSLIFAFFLPRTRSLWAICWCTSARWRPLAARCEADVDFLFHPKFW